MKRNCATLFILLALSVPLARAEDTTNSKFHFGDCVRVIKGFYQGCRGRVKDMHFGEQYEVYLTCKNGDHTIQYTEGSNLELLSDAACKDN